MYIRYGVKPGAEDQTQRPVVSGRETERLITSYYSPPGGPLLTQPSAEVMRQSMASGDGVLWVDIESASRPEAEPLLRDVFGFHHLAIDDCFNGIVDPAKIDPHDSYLFIIVQGIDYVAQTERLAVTELDLFIGRNYVVSFHDRPLPAVGRVRQLVEDPGLGFLARGADWLAHSLIDMLVDDVAPAVGTMTDTLERLEEEVITSPTPQLLEDVLLLKRNSQRLRHTMLPMRDVVARFSRGEYPLLIRPETQIYFRDIYDHVVRTEEMIETLREFADSAMNMYLSALNNRSNEVMKTLAVVGALALPATIVSSIYGTNFRHNIPGLEWEGGFYAMLSVMFAIMAGGLAYFRWRKWF